MAQVVAVVPTIQRRAVVHNGTAKQLKGPQEVIEYFEGLSGEDTILTMMGGPAQNLFVRAQQMGLSVQRIPWFVLAELVPDSVGTDGEARAKALKQAWEVAPTDFYPAIQPDETVLMLQELTRVRLNIQEYRKMATLQYKAALRDLEPILPEAKPFVNLRTMFANPSMVAGAKEDEKILEQRITALAEKLPIWGWLHPGKDGVLPQVKGLGPSLGGSLIGEIGDPKRFPTPLHLRSYARFGFTEEGDFPRRKRGELSSWNHYLNRAVWLWSTDQVWRWDHVWKDAFHFFLYNEFQRHPEVLRVTVKVEDGPDRIKTLYNLSHLYKRAQRKTGSALLSYTWGLWRAGEAGEDVERWFRTYIRNTGNAPEETRSTWDQFLYGTIQRELDNGRRQFVQDEIERRRALNEPSSDLGEEAEE